MRKEQVAKYGDLALNKPLGALIENVDLVITRYGESEEEISVFYGRCPHRGAMLADGFVSGKNLMCGVHFWDFRVDSGVSEYNNSEVLPKFGHWVEDGAVLVDADEVAAWHEKHPQQFNRDEYLGQYADTGPVPEEDKVGEIQHLANHGLEKWGHHGNSAAMGVPRTELPRWDDIQVLTAQLQKLPLFDDVEVGSEVVIGPKARQPLRLNVPLFVSDMSFGALSEEAKVSLAMGADAIALSNSAMQAIGCIAMRACASNNCPVGIAAQQQHLGDRLDVKASAARLRNYLLASVDLVKVLARACGHDHLSKFSRDDLSTYDEQMHKLTAISWAGGGF